jgi:hypothetical protein
MVTSGCGIRLAGSNAVKLPAFQYGGLQEPLREARICR